MKGEKGMLKTRKVTTKCQYCGKEIKVNIPKDVLKRIGVDNLGCACNTCIPPNSAARDGINESIYTEAKKNVNKDTNALILASIFLFVSIFTLNKWALFAGLASYAIITFYCFFRMFKNSISYKSLDDYPVVFHIAGVLGIFGVLCCLGSVLLS